MINESILKLFLLHEFQVWQDVRGGDLPLNFTKRFKIQVWYFNTVFQLIYLLSHLKKKLIKLCLFAGTHNQKDAFRRPLKKMLCISNN